MWKHRLTNLDLDSMIADCQHCGIGVAIVMRDRLRCFAGRQKGGTYGNTVLDYDDKVALFGTQKHCPICLEPLSYIESYLDHDHESGELRGFLCSNCNLGLGKLGDNVESLARALEYVTNPPLRIDEQDKG